MRAPSRLRGTDGETPTYAVGAAPPARPQVRAATILLLPVSTMARPGTLLVVAMLAGCGLFREPEPPPPSWELGIPASAIEHPKTRAWADRFCAKIARHSASKLGLVPSEPLGPTLEALLEDEGIPRELVAVPAIESGYQTHARGRSGELGLWQLMPKTARRFGLRVGPPTDERAQVAPSTRAAARYLAFLYARYEDWPLALAAYNAGEGRIDKALARRPGASFWELADGRGLPPISRDYVPKILAVVRLHAGVETCS
jgi:hypothetical protein